MICHKLKTRLAIASSSPSYWIKDLLSRFNLLEYFELILSRDDIKAIKPNPDIYLEALKRLQIHTHETVVIEDSPIGALAAISAGINCIAVPNSLTFSLNFPKEVYLVKTNLTEINFETLIKNNFLFPNNG